ncbi:MAG TPA: hypothetical protein VGI65_19230 [Steroidobacteraceae bacterium]|jgi:hypothetical protein
MSLIALGLSVLAPVLFSQPAYESPVRGDPDDLLLLPGGGLSAADTVVYEAVANTRQPPAHPQSIPNTSTASLGVADLVSAADAPHSLTLHLPKVMTAGQSYALWVVGPGSQWSAPVLINDARPLWITPDTAYQSASLANLPRTLKVVGRNLASASAAIGPTQVRLVGQSTGTTYLLTAQSHPRNTGAPLDRYAAVVKLPPLLAVDQYRVHLSRDGRSWIPLLGNGQAPAQVLSVLPDPKARQTFRVGDFAQAARSPCLPNDNIDDTKCILLAIRTAAAVPGGATVLFGPGIWTMSNPGRWRPGSNNSDILEPTPGGVTYDGILVPPGVSLQGAGSDAGSDEPHTTTIERGAGWARKSADGTAGAALPEFTLQGNNQVSGLIFKDDNDYRRSPGGGPVLQLGLVWYRARLYGSADPIAVSNVVISRNLFDKPYVALGGGGLPTDHLYVTYNTFGGAYRSAISLGQDTNEVNNLLAAASLPYQTYRFDDSVTDYNTFYPGSWNYAAPTGSYGEGTIATQINTGLRTDFSNNIADGSSTRYLYDAASDVRGWRAAHFWSTGANQEMTLVSSNRVSCPGDKNGDGEAFAYDGSVTLGGLPVAEPVVSAAPWTNSLGMGGTTLTLHGPLVTVLNNYAHVDISSDPTLYYRGFWVEIVAGTGKGQWRKTESLAPGAGTPPSLTLHVTPAFDVLPDRTSQVLISRAFWQNVTVDNTIDQRRPLCTKANTFSRGGGMTWYDSTADSAMEGNQLFDSGGVFVHHNYAPSQPSAILLPANVTIQSSNEIRDNIITGVYGRATSASTSGGIALGYGAAVSAPAPPVLGFGIAIAGNRLVAADSNDPMSDHWPRGAITLSRDWTTGPSDASGLNQWQLGDATLIFHNALQGISRAIDGATPPGAPRIGIGIDPLENGKAYSMNSWRSTLYGNSCTAVDTPLSETSIGTVRYCPSAGSDTCECRGAEAVDVGVTAGAGAAEVKVRDRVTYEVTVTNHHERLAADGVALTLEPSAGIQISDILVASGSGSCDLSTNVCLLGRMLHGQSSAIRVIGTAVSAGAWNTSFSVTHREPDPIVSNDGATLSTIVNQ